MIWKKFGLIYAFAGKQKRKSRQIMLTLCRICESAKQALTNIGAKKEIQSVSISVSVCFSA